MLGFIIVLVCVIGSIIWGLRVGKKRPEEMGLQADQLGLQFSAERNYRIADRHAFLGRLSQGENRYAYNLLAGTYQGQEITAFGYHYETHSTDSSGRQQSHHHHFSFFTLELESQFPDLTIARPGLFSDLDPAADIAVESPEFAKMFAVHSPDPKFAADFCTAQMTDYLLKHPDISITADQNRLVLGFGARLSVEEIEPHLNQLMEIRSLISNDLFG